MPGPDYILDLSPEVLPKQPHQPAYTAEQSGVSKASPSTLGESALGLKGRPWLAIHWKCCNVYGRVYRNLRGDAYEGQCPHCARRITATVGPGGTNSRFFTAE